MGPQSYGFGEGGTKSYASAPLTQQGLGSTGAVHLQVEASESELFISSLYLKISVNILKEVFNSFKTHLKVF